MKHPFPKRQKSLSDEEIESLYARLCESNEKIRKDRNKNVWRYLILLLLLVGLQVYFHTENSTFLIVCVAVLNLVEQGIALQRSKKQSKLFLQLELELSRIDDPRCIGLLLSIAPNVPTREGREEIMLKIGEWMRRLSVADTVYLTNENRALLRSWLKSENAETIADILRAEESIGDSRALTLIEKMASYLGNDEAKVKIKNAAQDCLPRLKARIVARERGEGLLRPASTPQSPETMLRATEAPGETDPALLLRATHKE